jgi:hypothetical protein
MLGNGWIGYGDSGVRSERKCMLRPIGNDELCTGDDVLRAGNFSVGRYRLADAVCCNRHNVLRSAGYHVLRADNRG